MSKLDELIKQYCPNGVEYKEISTIISENIIILKTAPKKVAKNKYEQNGVYKIIDQGQVFYAGFTSDKESILEKNEYVIFGDHTEIFKYVNFEFAQGADGLKIITTNKNIVLVKFLYYVLINNYKIRGGYDRHWKFLIKTKIPVPPIQVQEEIVKILDNFTNLTTELEAELENRRKQYEYYRDRLIGSAGNVKKNQLLSISEIYDGTHQTPQYTNQGVSFVSVENIKNIYGSQKYISNEDYDKIYKIKPKKNDIFMTRIGSIGECTVVNREKQLAYYVTLALIRPNNKLIASEYLKYFIESKYGRKELFKRTLVHAVPIKINLGEIGKILIPIPSLSEQERIVAILNKFDNLVNDMTKEGLPAEIEKRRKQYEYYRNKLLTFKELKK